MNGQKLEETLNHSLTKFKSIGSDQSSDLLGKVTFAQYKNLAQLDVQTYAELAQAVEKHLSEYSDVLKMELELKKKKCALVASRKRLDDAFVKASDVLKERNEKLENEDFDFLKPKPAEEQSVFAKPEPKKEVPLVEPIYSTRVIREKPQQTINALNSIMKPPTFSSSKFAKKENVSTKHCSLDDTLMNDHDITVQENLPCPRLNFDEIDDDSKTPVRTRNVVVPKSASRVEAKPLNLSSMPPPPVFTSSSGRMFNQE